MTAIPVHKPSLPFVGWIPDRGLQVGSSLKIRTSIYDQRIQINLQNGSTPVDIAGSNPKDDVMFHISVYPGNCIVRNHFKTGTGWGREEKTMGCSIKQHQSFEIVIKCEANCYSVTVNGQVSTFVHRLPLHMVRYISINGTCTVDYITFHP